MSHYPLNPPPIPSSSRFLIKMEMLVTFVILICVTRYDSLVARDLVDDVH